MDKKRFMKNEMLGSVSTHYAAAPPPGLLNLRMAPIHSIHCAMECRFLSSTCILKTKYAPNSDKLQIYVP